MGGAADLGENAQANGDQRPDPAPGATGTDRSGGYAIGTGDPMSFRQTPGPDSTGESTTPLLGRPKGGITPIG
jgi:hypothetical protein